MAREVEVYLFSVKAGYGGSAVRNILSIMDNKANVTILDRDSVFSRLHLASAIMHAARSIIRGEARARAEPLEIIRWLTGSHQVSKGIDIAGPDENTSHILVVLLPANWPKKVDMETPPDIKEEVWSSKPAEGLEPVNAPFDLGGTAVLTRMDIPYTDGSSMEEMERAVLEAVCLLGLK